MNNLKNKISMIAAMYGALVIDKSLDKAGLSVNVNKTSFTPNKNRFSGIAKQKRLAKKMRNRNKGK